MTKKEICGLLVLSLAAIFFLNLMAAGDAAAGKKKAIKTEGNSSYIPVEAIDSLKVGDIDGAIRNLRLEAASPRTKYLLRQLQGISKFEADKKKSKDLRGIFNAGVAYHNLFLFLKGQGAINDEFFRNALKYYKQAYRTHSPSKKSNIALTMAALYAAHGDVKEAEKFFKKADPEQFQDEFRRYETMALYYSAQGDVENAISNLEAAYNIKPEYTRFWLGISDDFIHIYTNDRFQALLKKWDVKPRDRSSTDYSTINEDTVH